MKRRLIISQAARRDLRQAADWYESKQSKELAVAFLEEMFRKERVTLAAGESAHHISSTGSRDGS